MVSTWTAAAADITKANRLAQENRILSARWLVDRSFISRKPEYCAMLRERFGDSAIRVWNAHAKFAVLTGGKVDILYLTSANLNPNRRLENYTIFAGGNLPREYISLVDDMFDHQPDGAGFDASATGLRDTRAVLGQPTGVYATE